MRKLSYLFMALSLLCFAVPAFAQGAEAAGHQLGSNHRRLFHGDCFAACARWARRKPRRLRPKPWGAIPRPVPEFSWR